MTLLSILTDHNNTVVWMVSNCPVVSSSSSPLPLLFSSFSHQRLPMVSNWSLSDYKSPQVSRIFRSTVADLNKAVVWMVTTRPLISKSPSPCTNLLVTVPSVPITIGITATFMFHRIFSAQTRSRYFSFISLSFSFTQWSVGTIKSTIRQVLFFCRLLQGLVVWPRLGNLFRSQSPK